MYLKLILVAVLFAFIYVKCLRVIPERAEIYYVNENYVKNFTLNVRRYSRKGAYYVNAEVTTLHTWGNNVSFTSVLHEYLHNEYRRTFIDLHFRFCDFLNYEPYVGRMLTARGIPCPTPPGIYSLPNMSFPMEEFPYVWPFEKIKLVANVFTGNAFILNASVYIHYLDVTKPNKKNLT